MSRNYKTIEKLAITRDELSDWADCRNTHMAVALAIHAIADDRRNPQQIWEDPTRAEWDHVTMAVEEYVTQGDFAANDDGRYSWGEEAVTLGAAA